MAVRTTVPSARARLHGFGDRRGECVAQRRVQRVDRRPRQAQLADVAVVGDRDQCRHGRTHAGQR